MIKTSRSLTTRLLALLLSAALVFPWTGSAYALREPSTAEKSRAARAGLEQALRSAVGLEESVEGWDAFSAEDRDRLRRELAAVDRATLDRLIENAKHPVVPPRTLYELLAMVLDRPESEVQTLVESLPDTAWQPPHTTPIGESQRLQDPPPEEVKALLERTVFVVTAGGAGARFKKSLPAAFREQLERLGRLEKPTVAIGPSGASPNLTTLEELSVLATRVGARGVIVLNVVGSESRAAVEKDLRDNGRWINRDALALTTVEQATFPSFDPATGTILTTTDSAGHPALLRNGDGTYGAFLAAYQAAQRAGVAEGKDWLVLYGDEPRLNTGQFIAQALHQRRQHQLDAAAVTIPKLTPTVPVGGTRVDLALPESQRIPLIIEKAERIPDAAKGIAGLPALNRVETQATASGHDPFGFSTGVLLLSAKAAGAAAQATRLLRYADRDRDDKSGIRRNLETFLTHVVTIVGAQGLKVGDLQVDARQYRAVKDWPKVAQALLEANRHSRDLLSGLPGGDRVTVAEGAYLDVRPGFPGFTMTGEGSLVLDGAVGYVLSPGGLYQVPIVSWKSASWKDPDPGDPNREITRTVRHPIFADLNTAKLLISANADGMIPLTSAQRFTAGLEERPLQERLHDPLVAEGTRWRFLTAEAGWPSYDAFSQDFLPAATVPALAGGVSKLLDELERQSQFIDTEFRYLDGGAGLAVALQEALASGRYPHLRAAALDGRRWTLEDMPSATRSPLAVEAARRGIHNLSSMSGVDFIEGDIAQVALIPLAAAPLRLVTLFAVLGFTDDPLGVLAHWYNQLDTGGYLVANLAIPTEHPQAEALRAFYEGAVADTLEGLGLGEIKVTDAQAHGAPAVGLPLGTQEIQVGIVLVKRPGTLALRVTPHAETFVTGGTARPMKLQVVRYEGDLNQPFVLRPASGLEERPRVVPIRAEYGRLHKKDLTEMDAAEPVWQEEGVWSEDRWSMDVRPSSGTRLENLFDLSFAVEDDTGRPAAYIYTTNGQPDYPVTRQYPGTFIFRLSVRQDQKGRRLGPLLLLASARAAQAKGIGSYVTLETDAKNAHARHVYESLGFVEVGQRVDPKKPTLVFIEYAALRDTLIRRAETQLAQRYGPVTAAGMEEDPVEAALRRGPVVFTVRPDGVVAMKGPGGSVPVEIPSDLLESGFFQPGAEVVMAPIPPQPPTWSGIRLVDQVGLSRRPDGVADYRDWRFVTKAKQFIGWLRTLPRDRMTAVLYRPRLIAPSRVRQWFPDKLMIQVATSVYPTVAQTRLLVSAAAANGRALSVDDLLQRFSYRGREVLLIAA